MKKFVFSYRNTTQLLKNWVLPRLAESKKILKAGLWLAVHSWLLYLVGLIVPLSGLAASVVTREPWKSLLILVWICLLTLQLGYVLALPKFLIQRKLRQPVRLAEIWLATKSNLRYIWVPLVVLIAITVALAIITGVVMVLLSLVLRLIVGHPVFFGAAVVNVLRSLFAILLGLLFNIWTFSTFFFALQGKTISRSLKEGLMFAVKHPFLTCLPALVYLLLGLLSRVVTIWGLPASIGAVFIVAFANLAITASCLEVWED